MSSCTTLSEAIKTPLKEKQKCMSNDNVKKVSNKAIQGKQKTTCTSRRKVNEICEYKRGQKKLKWKALKGPPLTPKPHEGEKGQGKLKGKKNL
jgi:hypothetical protein